ncbi:MarR family winged helix-turn-helix transcriptional regulator [Streptomyces sp. cmx-18-6]|uniref:MarR family winged helix-turn-helix transcriptional regulator n=1 Tax=Streptomyces sp. cmx-18-6 TaxID=2790930 RepID=UPI0039810B5C
MGVERFGPDDGLRDVAEAMRGVIELLEVYWTRAPDGASPVAVSAPQLRVMYVLERREGINLRHLGAELGAAPSSVSRLCDRLEALGFVRRSSSPTSRREVEVRLTAAGRLHLDRLRARRDERLAAVLARVTPASRARLREAVEALRAALTSVQADTPTLGTADSADTADTADSADSADTAAPGARRPPGGPDDGSEPRAAEPGPPPSRPRDSEPPPDESTAYSA